MKKIFNIIAKGLTAIALFLGTTLPVLAVTLVQIGTGTSVTSATGPTPFGSYYHDDRTQLIYTAAELSAAGMTAGNISSASFNVTSASSQTLNNFKVKMKHAGTQSVFTAMADMTGGTLVYGGTKVVTTGWYRIDFSTVFAWDGSSSVILEVSFDNTSYTSSSAVQYTSTSGYTVWSRFSDSGAGPAEYMTGGSGSAYRPNVKFGWEGSAGTSSIAGNAQPSADKNYIHAIVPRTKAGGAGTMTETVQYFDGLGRPSQTNLYKASADGTKDIITSVGYDNYGREEKQYLPFASAKSGGYHDAPTLTTNFTIYGSDSDHAYSQTQYEPSPLNRVQKQAAPGDAWYLGSDREVKLDYGTNAAGEVKYFYVNSSDGLSKGADYAACTLFKTTTWDENNSNLTTNSRTVEFRDKQGQVILKVSYDGTSAHPTYYVYDDFGLLRFVLPPKAASDGTVTATELDQLCYQYKYDERNRLKEKKLPGALPVYMVYDQRDRLVLTQSGTQKSQGFWMFTKFDAFNRPVLTGKYYSAATQSSLQTTLDAETVMYESTGTTILGYTNNAFPRITDESKYLSAVYYDKYDYQPIWGGSSTYNTYVSVYTDHTKMSEVKGLVTGTKTKVLETSTWLYTVNYYDKYGQLIQQFQSNPDGGYNRTSTAYNFTNQPTKQQIFHRRTSSSPIIYTDEEYFYDHVGRLDKIEHRYNQASTPVILAQNTYDEIGRLVTKRQHNNQQYTDYKYNIRGWLTQVNDPTVGVSNNRLFAMKLYYDTDMTTSLFGGSQYNGNINGVLWRKADGTKKGYNYSYDGLNRLTAADYGTYNGSWANPVSYDMSVNLYDKNGNIQSLTRKGSGTTNRELLTYIYSGNQLSSISGTYGGASGKSGSFSYDQNGNATSDGLRGLGSIAYFQEIDLPKQYYKDGNNKVDYTYDASGNKWKKTATTSGSQSTTSYYGPFIYEGTSLSKVLSAEGYYSSGTYHYFLKDHLGNTRITYHYSEATAVKDQEEEYYPFGSLFSQDNLAENKYLYNGKELQNEFFENYDYGKRFYDPQLARFHTVDPLSEKYYFQSPYIYAANNPILFIDWMGMEPKVKGPYSGRSYTRNNGTVAVYRITTRQRVMANTTKQAIYSTGWLGLGLSFAESAGAFDGKGMGQTTLGAGMKFGEDVSREASKQAIVGPNRGLFAKTSNVLGKMGTAYSAYQVARAAADNTPTQAEALHSATFNLTEKFQGGNVNIANSALMEFSNGENPESVENHMNAIYNTLEQNLSGFDLTTNKGVKEANKYLNNNLDQIIKQINQTLKDDEQE